MLNVKCQLGRRSRLILRLFWPLLPSTEIPTGTYLLRTISKPALKETLPRIAYWKFALSAVMRILNGYFFLVNVELILIQSSGVIDIFYDVLALQ